MGQSTNAILVYGYHLGGGDEEWAVAETDDAGELTATWYTDDEDDDVIEAVTEQLRGKVKGVKIEAYQSGSYPVYLLAAHVTTVHRGGLEEIDPMDLQYRPAAQDWDAKLRTALGILGLTPTQERPRWLLCSYWGI
jgi:hypothetical protein